MSIALIGSPFERARSAADPAVDPTSIVPERRASLALLDPADWTQLTVTSAPSVASSQPWSLMTRLNGLYVAKSMFRTFALHRWAEPAVPTGVAALAGVPSPETQPPRARAETSATAVADRTERIFMVVSPGRALEVRARSW